MKVNKTLSLDHSVVLELQKKNNQSAFVNAAILQRMGGADNTYDVLDQATAKTLMYVLKGHIDCDPFVKKILENAVKNLTTAQLIPAPE